MSWVRYMVVAVGVVFFLGGPFSASAATLYTTPAASSGWPLNVTTLGNCYTGFYFSEPATVSQVVMPLYDTNYPAYYVYLKIGTATSTEWGSKDSFGNTFAARTSFTFNFATPSMVSTSTPLEVCTTGTSSTAYFSIVIGTVLGTGPVFVFPGRATTLGGVYHPTSGGTAVMTITGEQITCDEGGSTLDCEGMVEAIASTTEAVVWTGHMQQYFYAILLLLLAAFGSYAFTKFFIKVW